MNRKSIIERNNSLDLLRCIACLLVCLCHVVSYWFSLGAFTTETQKFISCLYYIPAKMAISIFVMLSGAFLLEKETTRNYKQFYRKAFVHLVIPTLIFTVLYIFYKFPFCFIGAFKGVIPYLNQIYTGHVMAHMWFMYMIIVVYALAPIVARFKDSISDKSFHIFAYVFLILSCICGYTSSHKFAWDLGSAFNYLGFFIFGNILYKYAKRGCNSYGLVNIGIAMLILLFNVYLQYKKLSGKTFTYNQENVFSPLLVIAAVLMMVGFLNIDIRKDFSRISSLTFEIYLIHLGVWETIYKVYDKFIGGLTNANTIIGAPIWTAVVLLVSYLLAKLYRKIYAAVDKKYHIENKLLCLFKLNNR